jgi:putative transposase
MSRWELGAPEWEALDRMRFATTEAALFRNVTIILMTAAGRTKVSIARDLGCSPATVDNIRSRYQEYGREGLWRRKSPGRPSRATAEYRAVLRRTVQTPPQHLGYGFSTWSVARLGQHVKRQTGITFSEDQLERLLHQEGFSVQRPKHTLKGKRDEGAYEQARQELQDMKKKPWLRRVPTC